MRILNLSVHVFDTMHFKDVSMKDVSLFEEVEKE